MVERTLAGQLALLRLTAHLNQVSWGWPFWLISLVGMVIAVKQMQTRRMAICLALVGSVATGVYALAIRRWWRAPAQLAGES